MKGFKGPATAPGTGVGAIDPGADDSAGPGGGGKPPSPRLSLAPSMVGFDSQEGDGPSTKHVLVTNVGTAPAVISGIQSDANFQIGSNCPESLAPNAGCVIEATFEQKGQWGDSNSYQLSLFNGTLGWQTPNTPVLGSKVSYNAWHHVAVTRAGTTLRLFVDGVQVATYADNQNYPYNPSIGLGIGKVAGQNGYGFASGAIDEVRVSKGYARYTANFTPPSAAFTK